MNEMEELIPSSSSNKTEVNKSNVPILECKNVLKNMFMNQIKDHLKFMRSNGKQEEFLNQNEQFVKLKSQTNSNPILNSEVSDLSSDKTLIDDNLFNFLVAETLLNEIDIKYEKQEVENNLLKS